MQKKREETDYKMDRLRRVYAIGSDVHRGKGNYRRFKKAYEFLIGND